MALYDPKRDSTPFQLYAAQHKISRQKKEKEDIEKTKRVKGFGKTAYNILESKRMEDMTEAERLYNIRSPYTKSGRQFKYAEPKKSTWKTWFKDRYRTPGSERVVADTDYNQAGIEAKAKRDAGYAKIRDDELAELEKKRAALEVKYSQPYQFTEADEASLDQIYKQTYERAMDPTSLTSQKLYQELDESKFRSAPVIEDFSQDAGFVAPATPPGLNVESLKKDMLADIDIGSAGPIKEGTSPIFKGSPTLKTGIYENKPKVKVDSSYRDTYMESAPSGDSPIVPFPESDIKPPVTDPDVISAAPVSSDAVDTSVAAVETADAGASTIGTAAGTAGNIYSAYKAGSTLVDDRLTTEQKAIRTVDTGADIASTKAIQAGISTGNAPLALAGIAYKGFDLLGGPEALEELLT